MKDKLVTVLEHVTLSVIENKTVRNTARALVVAAVLAALKSQGIDFNV